MMQSEEVKNKKEAVGFVVTAKLHGDRNAFLGE